MPTNDPVPQAITSAGPPTAGYIGPDGTGMATGGIPSPFPFQLPPVPSSPDKTIEMLRELAPLIKTALGAIKKPGPSEADDLATTLEARGTLLVNHAVAIANIAHALGDMKEVRSRTETTGALEQAISRLANACSPVKEELPPMADGLEDDERAFVLDCLRAFAERQRDNDEDRAVSDQAASIFQKLCSAWRMRFTPTPQLAIEDSDG